MANANIPRGCIPVRYRSGAPYNGACNIYYVPSGYGTAIYRGDPLVTVTDSSDANGVQTVALATAGATNYITGFCIGPASGGDPPVPLLAHSPQYHPASTAGYVLVADDPEVLFEVQEDGVGGAMTVGAVGRNADLIAGTGSTVTGFSGWMLDSNTQGTGATLQMRIEQAVQRTDNDPTLTLAKWLVCVNLHTRRQLLGI